MGAGNSTDKSTEQSQANFSQTLQSAFSQQFGANQGVLNFLNGKLTAQANNPQGFSPQMLAAARTGAIQGTAADYSNAQQNVNNQLATRGAGGLPSGVNAQIQGQLSQGAANEESSQLGNINIANAQQQQSNYWNAINGLQGVAAQYNPNGYASSATGAANSVAGLTNAYSNSENSGFLGGLESGLGKGLGAGLSGAAGSGVSDIGSGNYGW
jgi:hypothetical protein